MKAFIAVLAVLAIMLSGCANLGTFTPEAQDVVDFVCSPTQTQMNEATKWLTALDNIQAGVSVAFPPLSIVKASTAMTVLKNGGCFVLSELEAALVLIGDMQTKQVATKGIKEIPMFIQTQFPVLWAMVQAGK